MGYPNPIIFTTDNSLSAVGSYRIVSFDAPFENIDGVLDYTDIITGEPSNILLQRSYRWSKDGINWSLWINFSPMDLLPLLTLSLDHTSLFCIEFKFSLSDDPNLSPELPRGTPISPVVTLERMDIDLKVHVAADKFAGFKPVHSLCSDEYSVLPVLFNSKFTFDPYNINRAVSLYKDLSNMVNQTFGHEVVYFRVIPQARSVDVILKEWTVFNVQQEKCIKVLVPNNEFPDSKFNFNQFGIDFEQPFEIHIDKGYFESFFGKNSLPQKRDVIYFPINNRIYEVQSSYIYRDFMQQPLYFKAMLVKYNPKADTIIPDDVDSKLKELTITTEDLFGEIVQQETEKITKSQQYITITHTEDPIRASVHKELPIGKLNFYNNWTLVAEQYYDMTGLFEFENGTNIDAVIYRATSAMGTMDNRAFTCWFQVDKNRKNGNATRRLLSGSQGGIGIDIDLIWQHNVPISQIVITINSVAYTFNLKPQIIENHWYALVVNVSNEFSQASVDLWQTQDKTSNLDHISHEVKTITSTAFDTGVALRLVASPITLTNVRFFKQMIAEEQQSIVMNQLVVKDSQLAIVIDNAKFLLKLARISQPR